MSVCKQYYDLSVRENKQIYHSTTIPNECGHNA